ncbi:MAG: hypothetical protein J0H05_13125 [Stenotrophomonas acidaminiphila]|jgi:hypothetical protein|uniref:hypothetical protein n=1 Tax=Stenotrophomonas acidaminiphila TaxID=128780 RepID=UPI0015F8177B|nr:hypothetical protein [Stenotrophomonas acidaminiphila]MBN8802590.1 hypothetical protein [Stenotrophomonas acidaminiphila]MDF9443333.1 hypothetical protein [Stenotrophomonas acidaminiphila]
MATQVQLPDDEALVLFELLTSGKLTAIVDTAEAHALGVILASLEKQLIAPFASDYLTQLAAARSSLVARYGK